MIFWRVNSSYFWFKKVGPQFWLVFCSKLHDKKDNFFKDKQLLSIQILFPCIENQVN